jgi:hypothetical protein
MCDRPPGLFEWAFGPRNFMKNPPRRIEGEQEANIRRGFSTLFEWAFGPRNPMKKPVEFRDFPDVRSGFSPLSPADVRGARDGGFSFPAP